MVNLNKELWSLKDVVDGGLVGNFFVVFEWKLYIFGEKLFYFKVIVVFGSVNVFRNKIILEVLIIERFKSKSNFRYFNVEVLDNIILEIDIGMDLLIFELLFIVLDVLVIDLFRVKLGYFCLIRKIIWVIVEFKLVIKKIFEVNFV